MSLITLTGLGTFVNQPKYRKLNGWRIELMRHEPKQQAMKKPSKWDVMSEQDQAKWLENRCKIRREKYERNRDNELATNRKYQSANRDKIRECSRNWSIANKEKRLEITKKWVEANPERSRQIKRKWYEANREKASIRAKELRLKRKKEDPTYTVISNLKCKLGSIVRGESKRTEELLGCSAIDFRRHLERQFKRGMNWENYGSHWHVDHILPVCSFNHADPKQITQCWHWTNLRPLSAKDNVRKRSKITEPQMSLLLCAH